MITPTPKASAGQRTVAALFFSFFLLMGLAFLFIFFIKPFTQGLQAKNWPAVPCRIMSSEVKTHSDSDGATYSVEIVYRYNYAGREYGGDRYQFFRGSSSGREGKAAVVARYRPGSTALCLVNPKNPSEAVLDRGIDGLWFGLIPLVFVIIGGGGVYMSLFGRRSETLPPPEAEAKPWLLRPDWAAGRSVASNKNKVRALWFFAVLWNLISTPVALVFFVHGNARHEPVALMVLMFPTVGLGFLIYAIRLTLRWKRLGEAVFELTQVPAPIGGILEGTFRPGRPVRFDGPATLKLACVSRTTSRSGDGDSTSEQVLWQHEEMADPGEGGVIPVSLRIPSDASETTTLGVTDGVLWRLEAKGRVFGGDCEASFEVPVFRAALSPEQAAKAQQLQAHEKADLAAYVQPRNSPIRLRAAAGGGTEFLFPARRNLMVTLVPQLAGLAFVGVFFSVIRGTDAPAFAYGVLGLFFVLISAGILQSLGGSKRVLIRPDAVEVTNSLLGIGWSRRIPASEVSSIRAKAGMQVGSSVYQNLKILRADGKEIDAGGQIKDSMEAEWLAAEMRKALGANRS